MTHDSQSTPITPEGLRGLGMTTEPEKFGGDKLTLELYADDDEGSAARLNVYRWTSASGWWVAVTRWDDTDDEAACTDEVCLGTAPDLETVARLIDVLRRMNGGDTCSI